MNNSAWEYRIYEEDLTTEGFLTSIAKGADGLESRLNIYGNEGWELVSAVDLNVHHGRSNSILYIFKRPRP